VFLRRGCRELLRLGFHSRSLFKCMDLENRILTEGACSDQIRKAGNRTCDFLAMFLIRLASEKRSDM
jgi:hypothetical protein